MSRCGECGGYISVGGLCVDCGTKHSPPRWLHPEIMLIGDNTRSRVLWTLENETDRIESLAAGNETMAKLLTGNGWTPRMIAWGHILDGLMDAAGFDDEDGRT